jgi:hypothetical protein
MSDQVSFENRPSVTGLSGRYLPEKNPPIVRYQIDVGYTRKGIVAYKLDAEATTNWHELRLDTAMDCIIYCCY